MTKRSIFLRLLIAIAILLVIPGLIGAQEPVCINCGEACPAASGDCTGWWMQQSWENMLAYICAVFMGYTLLVCCPS
jgi:hypothetical protein